MTSPAAVTKAQVGQEDKRRPIRRTTMPAFHPREATAQPAKTKSQDLPLTERGQRAPRSSRDRKSSSDKMMSTC